ncbi:MAG: tRNA lysidine(34) synthetase TilS [Candidatus Peregrinibacteria bacterium]
MNKQEAKKLENSIIGILKTYLKPNDTVILGISGGPDSTLLLHMLTKFQKKTPVKIIAAHVNHMLRSEAANDEEFIKKQTDLVLKTLTVDIKTLSKKEKTSLEETGRNVRYKFFKSLAAKYKARFILTAHHADDSLETIILNLARGATLKGLGGIKEIDKFTKRISLLRPLTNISKSEIIQWLKFKKIPFLTDKSNFSDIYARNAVRLKIIPELKNLNPSIAQTAAKNAKNFREINDFLETLSEKWLKENLKNGFKINAKTFRPLNPAFQKAVILKLYKNVAGNTKNIETAHVEEVLKLIGRNIGHKQKRIGKLTFSLKNNIISVARDA